MDEKNMYKKEGRSEVGVFKRKTKLEKSKKPRYLKTFFLVDNVVLTFFFLKRAFFGDILVYNVVFYFFLKRCFFLIVSAIFNLSSFINSHLRQMF